MAIPHTASGELIDVRPLGADLRQTSSSTPVRVDHLEVFRLVLAAGKAAPDHKASGALQATRLRLPSFFTPNGDGP